MFVTYRSQHSGRIFFNKNLLDEFLLLTLKQHLGFVFAQKVLTVNELASSRCVAKRQCFAPSALYRPFGEQAAGVRSLSEFRALQDGEKDLASLRELGMTETEIHLWRSRGLPEATEKVRRRFDTVLVLPILT